MTYIWAREGWPRFRFDLQGVQAALYRYAAEANALQGSVVAQLDDAEQTEALRATEAWRARPLAEPPLRPLAVATSPHAQEDQDFIDAVSDCAARPDPEDWRDPTARGTRQSAD